MPTSLKVLSAYLMAISLSGAAAASEPPPLIAPAVTPVMACSAPVSPLTVTAAVAQALCANPLLKAYAQDVKASAADVSKAQAAYLPTVSANFLSSHASATGSNSTHAVALNWLMLDFGGRSNTLAAAKALGSAADNALKEQAQALAADVAQAYFRVQAADASIAAADAQVKVATRALDVASARYKVGDAIKLDVLQAQSSLEQSRLTLSQAKSEAGTAKAYLAMLVAAPAEKAQLLQVTPVDTAATTSPPQELTELVEQAKAQRRDLAATRDRVAALNAQASAARAAHLPTVSLVGNVQWADQAIGGARRSDSIGVQVSIPIFAGGATQAQVRSLTAQSDALRERLQAAENQAGYEVVSSYLTLQSAVDQLQAATSLESSASEAQAQALARYEAGVGTMLEAFDSMAKRAAASQSAISARLSLQSARVQLARHLGQMPTL